MLQQFEPLREQRAAPQDNGSYAVIIAAYNEAATIRDVTARALQALPLVIVVDDGSSDGTAGALDGLRIVLIRNSRNLGKAASLRRGIEHALTAGARAVITLDGDGQHDPTEIARLMRAHERQPDAIVIGSRLVGRSNIPRPRYYANRFANFWIAWASGFAVADSQSGFRLYPAGVIQPLLSSCDTRKSFVFESEVLIEAGRRGHKTIAIPVKAIYSGHARRSHFRPVLDIALIARMIAWKLVSRGFCIPGLIRSLRRTDSGQIANSE